MIQWMAHNSLPPTFVINALLKHYTITTSHCKTWGEWYFANMKDLANFEISTEHNAGWYLIPLRVGYFI